MSRRYALYVPICDSVLLPPGTAIVGEILADGMILADIEEPGRAENVRTYEERCHHAADRRATRYPTSKRIGLNPEQCVEAAILVKTDDGWVIETIKDQAALQRWDEGPHHVGGSPEHHARAAAADLRRQQRENRPKLGIRFK